jgi:hypothetical protein
MLVGCRCVDVGSLLWVGGKFVHIFQICGGVVNLRALAGALNAGIKYIVYNVAIVSSQQASMVQSVRIAACEANGREFETVHP